MNVNGIRHERVRLADRIDRSVFDREFGARFVSTTGRPALPTRLVAGLLDLKDLHAPSDGEVVGRRVGEAIAHPTDRRLPNRAREQLADEAKAHGIELRPSCARVGPRAELQAGRYARARRCRRMRGRPRKPRGRLGRVIRDSERKAGDAMPARWVRKLALARRLHAQCREDSDTVYALHAPEVDDRGHRGVEPPGPAMRLILTCPRALSCALNSVNVGGFP